MPSRGLYVAPVDIEIKKPNGLAQRSKRPLQGLAVCAFTGLALLLPTTVASAAESPTTTAATVVTAAASGVAGGSPVRTDSMHWG